MSSLVVVSIILTAEIAGIILLVRRVRRQENSEGIELLRQALEESMKATSDLNSLAERELNNLRARVNTLETALQIMRMAATTSREQPSEAEIEEMFNPPTRHPAALGVPIQSATAEVFQARMAELVRNGSVVSFDMEAVENRITTPVATPYGGARNPMIRRQEDDTI